MLPFIVRMFSIVEFEFSVVGSPAWRSGTDATLSAAVDVKNVLFRSSSYWYVRRVAELSWPRWKLARALACELDAWQLSWSTRSEPCDSFAMTVLLPTRPRSRKFDVRLFRRSVP